MEISNQHFLNGYKQAFKHADMPIATLISFNEKKKKGDLSFLNAVWSLVARRAGLSITKTFDLFGFPHTTICEVYRELSEKRKINPMSNNTVGRNPLLAKDFRGEWPEWFYDSKATKFN